MLRKHSVSALALLLAFAKCAPQPRPSVLLTPQTRLGLGEGYGRGIVAATARHMRFELTVPAHVIVLRVTEAGIDQVSPSWGHDPAVASGAHVVTADVPRSGESRVSATPVDLSSISGSLPCVPFLDPNLNAKPDPGCVSRSSPRESPPQPSGRPQQRLSVDELGYWLLIVSDARTPAEELKIRLREFESDESEDSDDTPLLRIVQQLPGVLVGGRTTNWAAYYVGFAEVRSASH